MNNSSMMAYQEYPSLASLNCAYVPPQNGYYAMNSNPGQYNTMGDYNSSKAQMTQRPCYGMNTLSSSPPDSIAPNAVVSNQSNGKPVIMNSSKSYTEMNNVNASSGNPTYYLYKEKGTYHLTPPQNGFYGPQTTSPPFNQVNPNQYFENSGSFSGPNAPPAASSSAKLESISPPSAAFPRNSSVESFQTPGSFHQPIQRDQYKPSHSYKTQASQQGTSVESSPLQSPDTSPQCEYQARPATGRVMPPNVTVNFNNFGNSHIGIDTPLEFPLSFDFSDITQQNQCVPQQSFVNYA